MYESNKWYSYHGKAFFENPPIYMKLLKDIGYYIIALYPFYSTDRPLVSLFGPYQEESTCDQALDTFTCY